MNELKKYLENAKFNNLSKVQNEMLLAFPQNRNIVCIAPTGTGKTHSYLFPVLLAQDEALAQIQTIVLLPTNELVLQAEKMYLNCGSDFIHKSYYGSINLEQQINWLSKNQPHIIFATPEKLSQLLNQNAINTKWLKHLILDEADMMFTNDFMEQLTPLMDRLRPKQTVLLSATLRPHFKPFINKYFGNYITVDTTTEEKDIKEYWLVKETFTKEEDLLNIIKHINPYLAVIFVNKKEEVDLLLPILIENNVNVVGYSSNLGMKERRQIIKDIHNLKYQYVITTDLLSRGIDFTATHVINYNLPKRLEYFHHRSGRTGRMEKDGIVISLYNQQNDASIVQRLINQGINFKTVNLSHNKLTVNENDKKDTFNTYMNEARKLIRKPKVVKPNYKKKNKELMMKKARKLRRKKK